MSQPFDHVELMDRLDGDLEFLEESLEILDEDSAPLLEAIRAAVTAGDAAALVTSAHTLKGMLSNFCGEAAEEAARDLEARGRERRLDGADAVVMTLEEETARLRTALQSFLEAQRA